MTKKDRVAIVVSTLYLAFPLVLTIDPASEIPAAPIFLLVPLVAYWGYRFIKGDISFLKGGADEEA